MTKERFNQLLDELDAVSLNTLKTKNAKYAPTDDALHNFHAGAEIMGVTTAQCIWGYATKHIVALRDKIINNDFSDKDDTLEKIQDIINYLRFIWCAANEDKNIEYVPYDRNPIIEYTHDEEHGCENCRFINSATKWDDYTGRRLDGECATCKCNFVEGTDEYKSAPFNYQPI